MELKNTSLDDLAGVIGLSATIRLAAMYGGRNLYIPIEVGDEHMLARLIGGPAARRLAKEWPSKHLAIPTLNGLIREHRSAIVFYELAAGKKPQQVAALVGLTERRVWQLQKEYERLGLLPIK